MDSEVRGSDSNRLSLVRKLDLSARGFKNEKQEFPSERREGQAEATTKEWKAGAPDSS